MTENQKKISLKEAVQRLSIYRPTPFAVKILDALADITKAREKIVKRVMTLEEEKRKGFYSFYDHQHVLNILQTILHDLNKAGVVELKRRHPIGPKIGQEW